MVMMLCWLVIHTSTDAKDNRSYTQFRGMVIEEGTEINKISFANDFTEKHINTSVNNPIQWVKDSECLYAPTE